MFLKQMNEETDFGGKRSVRYKEGKMLLVFGHDEVIFKYIPKRVGLVQTERLQSSQKMKEREL
jgi:hypothetical protein